MPPGNRRGRPRGWFESPARRRRQHSCGTAARVAGRSCRRPLDPRSPAERFPTARSWSPWSCCRRPAVSNAGPAGHACRAVPASDCPTCSPGWPRRGFTTLRCRPIRRRCSAARSPRTPAVRRASSTASRDSGCTVCACCCSTATCCASSAARRWRAAATRSAFGWPTATSSPCRCRTTGCRISRRSRPATTRRTPWTSWICSSDRREPWGSSPVSRWSWRRYRRRW